MPDPVSNAEIEDVLSSIRRLVSDNAGAIRRDAEAESETGEKLVLTPAFRVDDEDPAADDAAVDDADETPSESRVAQGPVDPEPAVSPTDPEPEPEAAVEAAPLVQEPATSVFDDTMKSREEARPLSPLEQRIAELEAVVSRSATEFEPDGSEEDALPNAVLFHHRLAEQTRAEPETETVSAPEPDVPEAGHSWAMPEEDEDVRPVAALHPEPVDAPNAAAVPQMERSGIPDDDRGETISDDEDTPDWHQDEAEFETVAPVPLEADAESDGWEDVAEGPDDTDTGTDEAVIDEDALRDMVARMVREELQGSVGERITHNVRRMVRREIARALSLQEID